LHTNRELISLLLELGEVDLGLARDGRGSGLRIVLRADAVHSVPLIRLRMPFAEEHVPEVAAAVGARDLAVALAPAHRNVARIASIVAILVAVPALILELGGRRVERKLAGAAHEVARLGEIIAVFSTPIAGEWGQGSP